MLPSHETVNESGSVQHFVHVSGNILSLSETVAQSRSRDFKVPDEFIDIVFLSGPVNAALIKGATQALTKPGGSQLYTPKELVDFLWAYSKSALLRRYAEAGTERRYGKRDRQCG